jgi:ATP-dependent Lon protease
LNFDVSVILLKSLVILPNQEIKLELKSEISKLVIENSVVQNNGNVLVVAPLNVQKDLPKVGVIAKIKSKIALPNGNLRVTLRGTKRVVINNYFNDKNNCDILNATISNLDLPMYDAKEEAAVKRRLTDAIKKYVEVANVSNSILIGIENVRDLNLMTDMITSFLPFDTPKKLEYMQNINPLLRAQALLCDIKDEIEIINIEDRIDEKVNENLESGQKEYILREKLKEIKNELGETSLKDEDIIKFKEKLAKINVDERTRLKLSTEIQKYELASDMSPETNVLRNYIELVLSLPWNNFSSETNDIDKVKKYLNRTHYGLEDIKERVCEYVGIKNINPNISSPIICLVGPPGVGKTSIASSIAHALNREFIKISVGGLNDSTELVGSRRTYLGANPGKIIQSIKKCGTNNPVILIDEVDKMVKDYKGDPASTLLEILDPVQNKYFMDNYIEEPFDLSHVFFILTANLESDIPSNLIDRLEVINLSSYTPFEKVHIAKKYLLPKIFMDYGVEKKTITDEDIETIINNYTYESGVRDLDRVLRKYVRRLVLTNSDNPNIKEILGEYKYERVLVSSQNDPGVSNALAYTTLGGIVVKIETVKMPGNGNILITGMPGKVLEESVRVALDFLKTNYSINLTNTDIHIHFLDATSKKDGPSAGAAIGIALMSMYLDLPIPSSVAFTGELSLKGNILKVGGVKEKIIGAINSGITTIYIPKDNLTDLEEIPKKIMKDIDIIGVQTYSEIYKDVFKY